MSNASSDRELLGVGDHATRADIKRAYRELMDAHKADGRGVGGADMEAIEAAYRRLLEQSEPAPFSVEAREEENEESSAGTYPEITWGPLGVILITLIAFVGLDILVLLIAAGAYAQLHEASLFQAVGGMQQNLWWLLGYLAVSRLGAVGAIYGYVRSRGSGWHALGVRRFSWGRATGIIVAGLVGFFIIAGFVTELLERFMPEVDITAQQDIPFLEAATTTDMVLAFLAIVIIAPIVEEIIFRGFLLPAFAKRMGVIAAIVITSVLFGALHAPPLIAAVQIGLFAVFLSLAYLATRSVWPSVALHVAKNLIAFYVLFFLDVEQFVQVTMPLWRFIVGNG